MKTVKLAGFAAMLFPALIACNTTSNNNASTDSLSADSTGAQLSQTSYTNLSTGEPVTVMMDEQQGYYVYTDTKKPIERDFLFVDVNTQDTLYGPKGVVVNNALTKSASGSWALNEAMIERNGDDIKVKTADGKLKIDGDELKYKEGDSTKIKVDGNESKTKVGDSKTKTDGNETKTKAPGTKVTVED